MKNGQYYKVYGGDQGAYYQNKKWHRFECIGCMFAARILSPSDRLQGFSHKIDINKLPVEYRHDIKLHNEWLANGKPVIK